MRLRLGRPTSSHDELFQATPVHRELRVVLDADLLDGPVPDAWAPEGLLNGLLSHESVSLLRYSESGPPSGAERRDTPWGPAPFGWIEVSPAPAGGFATHSVSWATNEGASQSAIVGNACTVAEADGHSSAYTDLPQRQAATRRLADAIAASAAAATSADIYGLFTIQGVAGW